MTRALLVAALLSAHQAAWATTGPRMATRGACKAKKVRRGNTGHSQGPQAEGCLARVISAQKSQRNKSEKVSPTLKNASARLTSPRVDKKLLVPRLAPAPTLLSSLLGGADRVNAALVREGFYGSVGLAYFQHSREFNSQHDLYGGAIQFHLSPRLRSAHITGKIQARLMNSDILSGNKSQNALVEGYVTRNYQHSALRIGKQIVVWGRADGINPTDNLTPRNYTLLLPLGRNQRFGTTALKYDYFLTRNYTATLFLTPYFSPSIIPLPLPGITTVSKDPNPSLKNTEVALKINKTGGAADWSLSYFHGFNLLPGLEPNGFTSTGPQLALEYNRIDVIGADFATTMGRYGLRGDMAYFRPENRSGYQPFIMSPYLSYVAGGDRTFDRNLNIDVQIIGTWVNHYHDPMTVNNPFLQEIALQNAITYGQRDRTSYGLSARIRKTWLNNTLVTEILIIGGLSRASWYLRPLIRYSFTDNLKALLGADIYGGQTDTFYGRLRPLSGGFGEMKYYFQ